MLAFLFADIISLRPLDLDLGFLTALLNSYSRACLQLLAYVMAIVTSLLFGALDAANVGPLHFFRERDIA